MRKRSYPMGVTAAPPQGPSHVAAIGPTQVRKRLSECRGGRLRLGIVSIAHHEHADPPHAVALLRAPKAATPLRRQGA